jgi:hypothetical protein
MPNGVSVAIAYIGGAYLEVLIAVSVYFLIFE